MKSGKRELRQDVPVRVEARNLGFQVDPDDGYVGYEEYTWH